MASSEPGNFDFLRQPLELHVAGDEFRFADFRKRSGESIGVGEFMRGFVDRGLANQMEIGLPGTSSIGTAAISFAFCSAISREAPRVTE